MLKDKVKLWIAITGMALCFSLAITLAITFFMAFFNGGEVLVTINDYNEKWVEVIMIPVAILSGCYGLFYFTNIIVCKLVGWRVRKDE